MSKNWAAWLFSEINQEIRVQLESSIFGVHIYLQHYGPFTAKHRRGEFIGSQLGNEFH